MTVDCECRDYFAGFINHYDYGNLAAGVSWRSARRPMIRCPRGPKAAAGKGVKNSSANGISTKYRRDKGMFASRGVSRARPER